MVSLIQEYALAGEYPLLLKSVAETPDDRAVQAIIAAELGRCQEIQALIPDLSLPKANLLCWKFMRSEPILDPKELSQLGDEEFWYTTYLIEWSNQVEHFNSADIALEQLEENIDFAYLLHFNYARALLQYRLAELRRRTGQRDDALQNIREAISMLDEQGNPYLQTLAQNLYAKILRQNKQYTNSENAYKKALSLARSLNYKKAIQDILHSYGVFHQIQGSQSRAKQLVKEAFEIRKEFHMKELYPESLWVLGIICQNLAEYEEALIYLNRSLQIFEEKGASKYIIATEKSIGIVYENMGNLHQAMQHYQRCLALSTDHKNALRNTELLETIANIHLLRGEIEQASDNIRDCIEILVGQNNNEALASIYIKQAYVDIHRGNLSVAFDYLDLSRRIYESMELDQQIGETLLTIGYVYHIQEQFINAEEYYREAMKHFENIENPMLMSYCLFSSILIYVELGRMEEALYLQTKLDKIASCNNSSLVYHLSRASLAFQLKHRNSIKSRANGITLFEELMGQSDLTYRISVFVHYNLIDFYLQELKQYENSENLLKLEVLLEKFLMLAEMNNSYLVYVENIILQSHLLLIEGDLQEALHLIDRAEGVLEDQGISDLLPKLNAERNVILDQYQKLLHLVSQNTSLRKRLEEINIDRHVRNASKYYFKIT